MQADSWEAAGCFYGGGGSVPGCGSVCALAVYGRVMTEQRPLEKTDSDSLRRSGVPGDSELYRHCLCKHLTSKHTPPPPQPTPSLSLNPPPPLATFCSSLSASRSLISNYQAGSWRFETIAHQTWLSVPMEPGGQQMKSEVLNVVRMSAHVA